MYINRNFTLFMIGLLAGCATQQNNWSYDYGNATTSVPDQIYGRYTPTDTTQHKIAVLLPLSGDNAAAGRAIRTSVEMAALQHAPKNLAIAFYDTTDMSYDAINTAVTINPDVIIGPVFSGDARKIRTIKNSDTPVLSFTSDATALGDGVMTMALMPTNSIEVIAKEMHSDGIQKFIIVAPDTNSGKLMAAAARLVAEPNAMTTSGIFFYQPRDSESIKNTAITASMNETRTTANTRAREILSDILTTQNLTVLEKSSLNTQLEKISKSDTLGKLPYDAVLFLGDGDDSKTLASFLRYYGVGARDVRFYGTAMWDGSDVARDFTMSGAKYASLPETAPEFSLIYEQISGAAPSRLATFGYDATNLAIGMIYSDMDKKAYLLNPNGYHGTDSVFRIKPTGVSERALRVVELNGSGNLIQRQNAPLNFISTPYSIEQRYLKPAQPMALENNTVDVMNYIRIPDRFKKKFRSATATTNVSDTVLSDSVTILPEDDSDSIVEADFEPVKHESVNRTYIDSVEISE